MLKIDQLAYKMYYMFISTLQYVGIESMTCYCIHSFVHVETTDEYHAQLLLPSVLLLQE